MTATSASRQGGVCQHDLAYAVASGVHAFDVGASLCVDGNRAALEGDAYVPKPQPFCVGAAANGEEHLVRGDVKLPVFPLADNFARFYGQAFGGKLEVHAALGICLLQHPRQLPVRGTAMWPSISTTVTREPAAQ